MPNPLSSARRPTVRSFAGRASALALLAGLGAGCSADAVRLREPVFTGSTTNQQQILASQVAAPAMAAPAVPTPAVMAQPLPAVAGAAGAPQPYIPPEPFAPKGMPTPVGAVARVEPVALVEPTVQPVARPAMILAKASPEVALAGTGSIGRVHRVRAGDSVWSVAASYGVTADALIKANGLEAGAIRPGQELTIPVPGANEPTMQVASVEPKGQIATDAPAIPAAPARPAEAEAAPAQPAEAAEPARDSGPGFRWPVRGRVISGFGKKPSGERNDGINLAVPEGTSIKAAEDGVVIYAGNELKSYGNLVLIRHANGFVSAYAHSKDIKVQRGEQIRRGQIIAEAGMTGGVDTPQVHFELRKGATPVNPLDYLAEG
jgi:murein DD-endopeptidase MepM/ murein hydrolase activator NlpD